MAVNKIIKDLFLMPNVKRSIQLPSFKKDNIAEHSHRVACYCSLIGEELVSRGSKIQMDVVLQAALFHDISEIVINDIPYQTKKDLSWLCSLDKFEQEQLDKRWKQDPEEIRKQNKASDAAVDRVLKHANTERLKTEERKLVGYCDMLDFFLWTIQEIKVLGNNSNAVKHASQVAEESLLKNPIHESSAVAQEIFTERGI